MADISLDKGIGLLKRRAGTARIGIYLFAAGFALMALCEIARLTGHLDLDAPGPLLLPAAGVYLASFAIYLLSVVFVSLWIYRAHANLRAAGIDGLEYTPGWSVGWFFIPVANLFKPFQAMRELCTASHNQADSYGAPAPHELTLWWGTFIVGNMLINMSSRFDNGTADGAAQVGILLNLVGTGTVIASAFFLLRIIERVTQVQQSVVVSETFA